MNTKTAAATKTKRPTGQASSPTVAPKATKDLVQFVNKADATLTVRDAALAVFGALQPFGTPTALTPILQAEDDDLTRIGRTYVEFVDCTAKDAEARLWETLHSDVGTELYDRFEVALSAIHAVAAGAHQGRQMSALNAVHDEMHRIFLLADVACEDAEHRLKVEREELANA